MTPQILRRLDVKNSLLKNRTLCPPSNPKAQSREFI